MSNLDNILQKIGKDAQEKADVILDKAKQEAKHLRETEELKAYEEKNTIVKKADLEAKRQIEKSISQAKLKARDMILSAKEEVLQRVMDLAKEDLDNLDESSYLKYLKNNLKDLDISDDAVLRVPAKYRDAVKREIKDIKISDEDAQSGFTLSSGKIMYNSNFSYVLDSKRELLEAQVAKELFNE